MSARSSTDTRAPAWERPKALPAFSVAGLHGAGEARLPQPMPREPVCWLKLPQAPMNLDQTDKDSAQTPKSFMHRPGGASTGACNTISPMTGPLGLRYPPQGPPGSGGWTSPKYCHDGWGPFGGTLWPSLSSQEPLGPAGLASPVGRGPPQGSLGPSIALPGAPPKARGSLCPPPPALPGAAPRGWGSPQGTPAHSTPSLGVLGRDAPPGCGWERGRQRAVERGVPGRVVPVPVPVRSGGPAAPAGAAVSAGSPAGRYRTGGI